MAEPGPELSGDQPWCFTKPAVWVLPVCAPGQSGCCCSDFATVWRNHGLAGQPHFRLCCFVFFFGFLFLLNGTWGQWKDRSVNHEQNFWKLLELLLVFFFFLLLFLIKRCFRNSVDMFRLKETKPRSGSARPLWFCLM